MMNEVNLSRTYMEVRKAIRVKNTLLYGTKTNTV